MFTGIVEELGTVRTVRRGARSASLTVQAPFVLQDAKVGDSIAHNGVCLTITSIDGTCLTADVMPETLDRSSLGALRSGSKVNLERALRVGNRLGGHIVSGHIDGTGRITRVSTDDNAVRFSISAAPELMRYIVEKGSVAVDGISLTVACVYDGGFEVSVIPHTRQVTSLNAKDVGDVVNLEADLIGKYVEALLGTCPTPPPQAQPPTANSGLTMEQLLEAGL